MRSKLLLPVLVILCSCVSGREVPRVIPCPSSVKQASGVFDAKGARVVCGDDVMPEIKNLAGTFSERFSDGGKRPSGNKIMLLPDDSLGPETYVLNVRRREVTVRAADYNGFLYGLVTLEQLLPQSGGWDIPCVEIADAPRFSWRGQLLDCSRHFFSVEEIKKLLDVMCMYKLNRFHWHITDDHGWRIEIKKYPLLTSVGAYRDGTMREHDMSSNDGIRYGGYYSQEQVKEVVAYASARGIQVVPEIDLPAHMVSALTAYPFLGCTGGPYELMTVWDISKDVLCPGKETSFLFLEDIFSEICDLFPYEYIHIGGDECPKDRWKDCPDCQRLIHELGLKDTSSATAEQYLQNYVTSRVQDILSRHGRRVIGWDEILEGDLKPGATIMSWRGIEGGMMAAEKGFDVIMSPLDYCYLDYCQSETPETEPLGIGHCLTVEKCYSYEPLEGLGSAAAKHILGVQSNLWTEFIATPAHLEYMLLPRMLALSEVGWSLPSNKDYPSFRDAVIHTHIPRLRSLGYSCCRNIED